jgi:thiamine-phosphate pyrophosphorylase
VSSPIDLTLYFITDPEGPRDLVETVLEAVDGGATVVQLRHKHASDAEFLELGRTLQALLAARRIPLLVNDRVEIAQEIGAAGAHVGQGDLAAERARAILGPDAIIGLSAYGPADVSRIDASVVDYVGLGSVFPTSTKTDLDPPIGLAGFAALRAAIALPVVAIGGIHEDNAAGVFAHGADGIAVVTAISRAPDPRSAASRLAAIAARAKTTRT